jgi:hypothetical protein
MLVKKEKIIIYLILFLLAASLFSFSSVFAQGKKFLQKKPNFKVDLQQPSPGVVLEEGAVQALLENCITAVENLVKSRGREGIFEDIATHLGHVDGPGRFIATPIDMAYQDFLNMPISGTGAILNATQSLQHIANFWGNNSLSYGDADEQFRQQGAVFIELHDMMRDRRPQLVAHDEQLNQKILQLTGQERANQFIEDSQGSCGLTPENSRWLR